MPESRDRGLRSMTKTAIRAVEGEKKRFILSFSSEEPYERWFGPEILSHAEGAVDLTRLNEIGVLLFNHDRDKVVGKILSAWIEDKRGMAEVEFDTDDAAQLVAEKVETGTLKATSVAYSVESWEEVSANAESVDGFAGPCSIARKWTPLEVSIVSVPADPTVGVGREMENITGEQPEAMPGEQSGQTERRENPMDETKTTVAVEEKTFTGAELERAVEAERQRIGEITNLCKAFGMDAAEHIEKKRSMDEVREIVLSELRKAAPAGTVEVKETGADNLKRDMSDALLLRSGIAVKDATKEAQNMRGMSLRDMAVSCLSREGESMDDLLRMSNSDLFDRLSSRSYYSPTAAFPAILDNTINKSIVEMYNLVPTTFEQFCAEGTLSDFKESRDTEYVLGGGQFFEVPEGGELKHSNLQTVAVPKRKLKTYGTQFSMTREAFINDDIDLITRMPGQYAAKARQTINKQVYSLLVSNPTLADGKTLFHADHGNLIGSGAAPGKDTIQAALMAMLTQTDPFGDAILMAPRSVIVPVGYRFALYQVLNSEKLPGSDYNDPNPLLPYGLQVVEDPNLNALAGTGNAIPWFVAADKNSLRGIQVDYLNGQKTPTVRRMEQPGVLGYTWDIYMDWGITVIDHRALVKNPGTTL